MKGEGCVCSKIFAGGLFEDRRREGAKDFAVLDAAIQNVLHLRAARIGQNAAIAERARAPFGAALKPADDFSRGDVLRRGPEQCGFVEFRDPFTAVAGIRGARPQREFAGARIPGPSRRGP